MSKKPAQKEIIHNDLILDVEETLKREDMEKFWKEYGSWIIGGIILAVALTAIMSGWRAYEHKTNAAQTALLAAALGEEEIMPAVLAEAIPTLHSGHRAMAYLAEAGALLQSGKEVEALAVYKQASADKTLPALWHDLAVLMAVRMEWATTSEQATGRFMEALEPLAQDEKNPWYYHARLQMALMVAHDKEDYTTARAYLATIQTARDIPPSLKERARALDHIYTINSDEAAEKPEG